MGIRLKRQTNATATAYAGAVGGKGRRQAEEAIRLAQLQASASGGRGGTSGGGYQGGSAPTTHAQTSSAALGSPGSPIAPSIQLEKMREASAKELQQSQQDFITGRDKANREAEAEAEARRQAEAEARRAADLQAQKEMFDYKYTQQQRREIDDINATLEEARKSGRFSPEQLEELERQAYTLRMGIKPLPTLKEEPNAPNIQTDADGRKWIESSPGKWERIDDGSAQEEKRQEALRQQEAKRQEHRNAYILKSVEAAQASHDRQAPFDFDKAIKEAAERYDSVYGVQTPADERNEKWRSFAD